MRPARSRLRGALSWAFGVFVVWAIALVIAGFFAEGCVTRRVESRIGFAFEADAGFKDSGLSLLRGEFTAEDLVVTKDDGGSLRATVAVVDADLAPLGWAIVDSSPSTLRLSGIRLEASSLALLRTRGHKGKRPFRVDALEITDAHLSAMPTLLLPSFGRLEIHIERATAGPIVMRTALSWVFALEELVARVDLPGGVTVKLDYHDGKLHAQGGVFGSTPIEVPFAIPILDPAREIEQLQEVGIDLVKKMTISQAEKWIQRELWDRVKEALP